MKYKPEAESTNTKDMPNAEAGTHRMKVASYSPEVTTSKWSGAIVEFVTLDDTAKISEFINAKTAWKFGRLAKAIGDDARKAYHETDPDGFSCFVPGSFLGREVIVEVEDGYGQPRIASISAKKKEEEKEPEVGDPQNLDDGRHDSGTLDDSDLPF
jgi:hypothetical protein